jgi:uncharacterized protein (TIGR00255 family)
MTGHGHSEVLCNTTEILIDIFSTNHRQLDITFDLPSMMMIIENDLRNCVKRKIRRGSIFCKISVAHQKQSPHATVVNSMDCSELKRGIEELKKIGNALDLRDDLSLSDILANLEKFHEISVRNAINHENFKRIFFAFNGAIDKMIAMREKEGNALTCDMVRRLKQVELNVNKIEKHSPEVAKQYRQRLTAKLKELTREVEPDEERIMKEVVFVAERADIAEEITRLKSHINQFNGVLSSDEPYGKKLDFLLQEMMRECSTIAAKANNTTISHLIVDCRADIERIREQVQNLE